MWGGEGRRMGESERGWPSLPAPLWPPPSPPGPLSPGERRGKLPGAESLLGRPDSFSPSPPGRGGWGVRAEASPHGKVCCTVPTALSPLLALALTPSGPLPQRLPPSPPGPLSPGERGGKLPGEESLLGKPDSFSPSPPGRGGWGVRAEASPHGKVCCTVLTALSPLLALALTPSGPLSPRLPPSPPGPLSPGERGGKLPGAESLLGRPDSFSPSPSGRGGWGVRAEASPHGKVCCTVPTALSPLLALALTPSGPLPQRLPPSPPGPLSPGERGGKLPGAESLLGKPDSSPPLSPAGRGGWGVRAEASPHGKVCCTVLTALSPLLALALTPSGPLSPRLPPSPPGPLSPGERGEATRSGVATRKARFFLTLSLGERGLGGEGGSLSTREGLLYGPNCSIPTASSRPHSLWPPPPKASALTPRPPLPGRGGKATRRGVATRKARFFSPSPPGRGGWGVRAEAWGEGAGG